MQASWHRGTDTLGRSVHYLAGSGLGVVKIEGVWFVQDLATGELQTWRTSLGEAKSVTEFIADGAK